MVVGISDVLQKIGRKRGHIGSPQQRRQMLTEVLAIHGSWLNGPPGIKILDLGFFFWSSGVRHRRVDGPSLSRSQPEA